MMVSFLLFADDTLIFCDADPTHIASLRSILARFEEVSGLSINLGQSELVPIGEVHNPDVLVGYWVVGNLLFLKNIWAFLLVLNLKSCQSGILF